MHTCTHSPICSAECNHTVTAPQHKSLSMAQHGFLPFTHRDCIRFETEAYVAIGEMNFDSLTGLLVPPSLTPLRLPTAVPIPVSVSPSIAPQS